MTFLEKLLSIASGSLNPTAPPPDLSDSQASLPADLASLLRARNGFVAFESALVVFPRTQVDGVPGVQEWNNPHGWRAVYRQVVPADIVFFASDLFCGLYGTSDSQIVVFNPETGEVQHYADTLDHWAKRLLENYTHDTGWPLATAWQRLHGPLPASKRLLPIQPFVLGGDYVVHNLIAIDFVRAIESWARLYLQIREVPDGGRVVATNWLG